MTPDAAAGAAGLPPTGAGDLVFVPLGGTGEIGMNMNLYGHAGRWLMVDCGVTFGDDGRPGVDVVLPDPQAIEAARDRLDGLVLTHGHEDHIGAVPWLWPRLRCPVYATPFTARLVRGKLADAGLLDDVDLREVEMSGRFRAGPFELELITLTHSIPEPSAVVLRTGAGTVLHTGDWKIDPGPVVGETADEEALRRLGDGGVLAMICDSTNALVEGVSGSEEAVRESLGDLIGQFAGRRIAVACFASNVARLESVTRAAMAHDRHVALVGRSLWRMDAAARDTGYLAGLPPFVAEEDAGLLPRGAALLLCTGSQGEPRAALARIAQGDHPAVTLDAGDVAIFSSRVIPGNEVAIGALQNRLAAAGIEVVTGGDRLVHVSGHPARDELVRMYQWVRPRIAVPTHGEPRHMLAHAELARACQVSQVPVIANGDVLRLAPGDAGVVGRVAAGRLAVDGSRLVAPDGEEMRARQRMLWNGSAVLTLVVDGAGRLAAAPQLAAPGLLAGTPDDRALADRVLGAVEAAVAGLPSRRARSDEALREAARRAVRRAFRNLLGKRPPTDVHLVRTGGAPG